MTHEYVSRPQYWPTMEAYMAHKPIIVNGKVEYTSLLFEGLERITASTWVGKRKETEE